MLTRLLRFAIFVLAFSFGVSALAQTTVTLQQGLSNYPGASDSWISCCSAADLNKGTAVELDTRQETGDTALLRFNIFQSEGGPVPNGATITSATLSLYKFWGPDVVFQAARLLKPWNEAQVTWNIAAAGSAWTSSGALSAGNDYLASPDGQGSVGDAVANGCNTVPNSGPFPAACWLNIDVTPGVQAFSSGTQNFGWKLRQVSSSDLTRYKNFNSKEFVTVAGRPKLTITYTPSNTVTQAGTASTDLISGNAVFSSTELRVTLKSNGAPIQGYHLMLDTDTSAATGFRHPGNTAVGAEYMVENGNLYRFTGAAQTDWSWSFVGPITTTGLGTTQIEVPVALSSIGYVAGRDMALLAEHLDPTFAGYDLLLRSGVWRAAPGGATVTPPSTTNSVTQGGSATTDLISGTAAISSTELRVTLKSNGAPIQGYHLMLDTDTSAATGFLHSGNTGVGAEYMVENGNLYRFTGAAQTDWSWSFVGPIATVGLGTSQIEVPVALSSISYVAGRDLALLAEHINPTTFAGYDLLLRTPGVWRVGPGKVSLVTPLALSPASPTTNQATTATFSIKNTSTEAVTVQIKAAARDSADANVDFPATASMTLQPQQQFDYSASRSFATAGSYGAWPTYFDGVNWIELAGRSAFTVGQTPPTTTAPVVNNLTLMNADTNAPIAGYDPIPANATIDLAAMPTRRLNIRANTSPATVGSVSFGYDASANVHVDNGAPYQLSGDPGVDYADWTPSVGNHNVAATAFTGSGASGTAGPTSSVSFTVTDSGTTTACTGDNLPTSAAAGTLGSTVQTFHSMSVYYNPPSPPSNGKVWMRYRRACESVWRQGWPLWFDPRTSGGNGTLPYAFRARGSAVYLEPGTKYYFELAIGDTYESASWNQARYVTGSTWPETFAQDGATTVIAPRTTPLDITVGGSQQTGYKVYDGQNNSIALSGTAGQDYCVRVTKPYVIVRRVQCSRGYRYGITVAPNVTNVVIEDNDISDWSYAQGGTTSWGINGGNEYGGVQLEGNNAAIVIQRNKIHDVHYGSHPWDVGHPNGPTGVMMVNAAGQNVVRYNEIYASGGEQDKTHWLQDGIMGTENDSSVGAPGADSDIYHNIIKHVFDDGIEAEGGGRNVRVWGNYIDHVAIGIATSHVHFGPSYVFRNVINTQRYLHRTSGPDGDAPNWSRGKGFKAYGRIDSLVYGGGRQYFFHNTFLQQPGSTYVGPNGAQPQTYDLGAGTGIAAAGSGQGLRETWSRNNIFQVFRSNASSIVGGSGGTATNDINFDLYNGVIESGDTGQTFEAQGIRAVPVYKSGHGWSAGPRLSAEGGAGVGIGNFQLDSSSNGLNAGTPLPNFTFDIDNERLARKSGVEAGLGNPDMGAHESGATESMKFGLTAGQ